MKTIIATTTMALMMTTASLADTSVKPVTTYEAQTTTDFFASELIGMRIYSAEKKDYDGWDESTQVQDNSEKEWDDIGEINDIILGKSGEVKAVILGIGGFAGINEKDLAIDMKDIKIVNEKDSEDFFLVVNTNGDMLKDATPFTREEDRQAQADEAKTDAEKETAAADETKSTEETASATTTQPATGQLADVKFDGFTEANIAELKDENLIGARVYSVNGEDIGEVDKVLAANGSTEKFVIDVGGFLGLGEKPVAVTADKLRVLSEDDGDEVRVYINATQEELEKEPAYES